MSKKTLAIILGCSAAISGAIAYYLFTMRKVKEIEEDSLEDEEFDDFEDMIDEDIESEFDKEADEEGDTACVEFDDEIPSNKIFETVNRACEADEPKLVDDEEEDAELNPLDYESEYFEMVCQVSRDKAIAVILKNTDKYTKDVLSALTNSELADIYSKIIDN